MNKNFASKLLFQFGVEWDYLSKNVWNISLFRVYSKILILELNQLKNQQFMAFYSSLQFVINLSDISTRTVTLL